MGSDKGCADVIRVYAVVTGMVQGVGFRYFVVTKVRAIGGISGWVRNRFDGSVEVEAQGSRSAVAQLVSALKIGPRWSQVEHVAVDEIETDARSVDAGFRVLADG